MTAAGVLAHMHCRGGALFRNTQRLPDLQIPNDNRDNNTNESLEFVFSLLIYTVFSMSPLHTANILFVPGFFIRQLVFTIHSETRGFLITEKLLQQNRATALRTSRQYEHCIAC